MPRIPTATYRLQFHKGFTFADACKILDYLQQLGISDVYASPVLTSRPGSTHGYDGTDPSRIDPDLGGEEGFATFQQELQKRRMGLLLDIVPNHMAASSENRWWMDVLENGPDSTFASYFDIDWRPGFQSMDGRILLPVLGKPFGEVLDSGDLVLTLTDAVLSIKYFDLIFPVAPRSYRGILQHAAEPLRLLLGSDTPAFQEFSGILAALETFSTREPTQSGASAERRSRFAAARDRLRELVTNPDVDAALTATLAKLNGDKNDPASFNELQTLLGEQHYKLAYWQNVNESINYRRFFAITELIGMRVEDPLVFDALHTSLLRLTSKEVLTGIRIDHIDGLKDPAAYLSRLQQHLVAIDPATPAISPTSSAYVLVEKILARGESLPLDWPVSGTTGYDFLNFANDVFVDTAQAQQLATIYADFTGKNPNFADILYQKKKLVMSTLLGVEMRSLGRQLADLSAQDRYARELPRTSLLEALIETTACVPAYRTYIRSLEVPAEARDFIELAVRGARERKPHLDPACFAFLRDVLLLENPAHVFAEQREARLAFVLRWQQITGPIVAKGIEDTALYVYHPLLSLNEVGGDPQITTATSARDFWNFLEMRRAHWPHAMNASTTHDTKRSEDVRARINVLSEIPEAWAQQLQRWSAWNARHKATVDGQLIPDRNEEYFLYQTLLGAWPLEKDTPQNFESRIQDYMVKAIREAMVHTRWTRPNEAHENALHDFVSAIVSDKPSREFLADFRAFQESVAYFGMLNGLAQTLLKMTAPGVPDFFQGSELWDLRLVDPDNRQPVDFAARTQALTAAQSSSTQTPQHAARHLFANWKNGIAKLWLIRQTLQFRREHPDLFAEGAFLPADVRGPASENILAFLRHHQNEWSLTVVPRWLSKKAQAQHTADEPSWNPDIFRGTSIVLPGEARGSWTSALTGPTIKAADNSGEKLLDAEALFADFPVALLAGNSQSK
jgi:(1->4)-alpha-D-glucan 1-alpha-D-glucosylmutase